MADITKLKPMNEYIEQLNALSAQAQADGKNYVSDFIKRLICQVSQDVELVDYIYKSTDELREEMTKIYNFFLKGRFDIEWYKLVSFINEEKKPADDFYRILYNCVSETNVSEIRNVLEGALTAEQFEAGIKPLLPVTEAAQHASNELLVYVKNENTELKERISELLKDLNESRQETMAAKEEVFAGRKKAMESKLELERLRKVADSGSMTARLTEKKIAKYIAMAKDTEAINDSITEENKRLETELKDANAELLALRNEKTAWESQLKEKTHQLEKTVLEVERLQKLQEEMAQTPIAEAITDTGGEYPHEEEIAKEEPEYEPEYYEVESSMEDDTPDYDVSDLVYICDNKKEVIKHSNLLTTIFTKYQDRKFQKKSKVEQENLIFIRMMDMALSKSKVQMVKTAIDSNSEFSRLELYKLITNNATESELSLFLECEIPA